MCKKLTTDEFIQRAKKVHEDKYDYSLVDYQTWNKKIKIICPIHGTFEQSAGDHLRKKGCLKCAIEKIKLKLKDSKESFIEKSKKVHGNKFNYSLVEYVNAHIKVKIICPIHGLFEQTPNAHTQGASCPKCFHKPFCTTEKFIKKAQKTHKNKYDYSLVNYKDSKAKVKIICPIHGIFKQTASNHIFGAGCPICKLSKGENLISDLFNQNKITYKLQHKFKDCFFKRKLPFDFFLKKHNCCVEFHGEQHFNCRAFFVKKEKFDELVLRDKNKEQYCKNNNISLIIVFKNHHNDKIIKFVDLFNNAPKEIINVLKSEKMIQYSLEEYENFKQKMLRKN